MRGMLDRAHRLAGILLLVLVSGACGEPLGEAPRPAVVPDAGPIVARVGGQQLHRGRLPALAALAEDLRRELDLPAPPADSPAALLDRAVEVVALAEVAAREGAERQAWFAEERRRLLARVYLQRLVERLDARPVAEEQVRRLYQQERHKLRRGESSEIFSPSRVDGLAVVVAFFPDLHVPGDWERPLLDREQARQLAGRIHRRARGVARDTDAFLAVVRGFMKDHPAVQVKEFWHSIIAADLTRMDPRLHRQLVELPGPGSLSQPFVTDRGVVIMRRGITIPGKGESLERVRKQLEEMLRHRRRTELVEKHLQGLREKLAVRVYSERLRGSEGVVP